MRKKTGAPYVSHLLSVCALVLEHGGDEDEAIAALLHDGPEDCGGRVVLDRIRARFGDRVAAIVEGCTDAMQNPKPDWLPRKRAYLRHLHTASPSVLLVSAADKVHNVRSILADYRRIGADLWQRFSGSRDETLWYYREVASILRRQAPSGGQRLVDELERDLTILEALVRSREEQQGGG